MTIEEVPDKYVENVRALFLKLKQEDEEFFEEGSSMNILSGTDHKPAVNKIINWMTEILYEMGLEEDYEIVEQKPATTIERNDEGNKVLKLIDADKVGIAIKRKYEKNGIKRP